MPLEIKVLIPFAPLTLPSGIPCSTSALHIASPYSLFLPSVEQDLEWKPPEPWRLKNVGKKNVQMGL